MLYHFVGNSLYTAAPNLIDINPQNYTINRNKDGVSFLKEIISKAYVDANAAMDTIGKSIAKLDNKIKDLKYDIKAFNAYVQTQVNALLAHGVQCMALLTNLFSAFGQVQDSEFEQHVCMFFFPYITADYHGQDTDLVVMEQHYHCRELLNNWNPKQLKTDKNV
jgi:hypothetical protein